MNFLIAAVILADLWSVLAEAAQAGLPSSGVVADDATPLATAFTSGDADTAQAWPPYC